MLVVLDFGFSERGLIVYAPIDGARAFVNETALDKTREQPRRLGLVVIGHRAVGSRVTMVPEGLTVAKSLTYAVAALRIARRGALTQQLKQSSRSRARPDKTGTLTDPALRVGTRPAPELGREGG